MSQEDYTGRDQFKGRGAQINTPNRFESTTRGMNPDYFADEEFSIQTQYIESNVKSIINEVPSPDVYMDYSINPYQGCEHGCVYCYARNSHNYWGYSAGIDFESKIIVKTNAVELLRKKLKSKNWKAAPIMLSGNTDCYQPAEKKYEITRGMLETFREFGHPVGIITKNSMLLRDLDILKDLAKHDLVAVNLSINSLQEEVRQFLEPRTATYQKRLDTIKILSDNGIPTRVLLAPVIPGLTDSEIFSVVKASAEAGARGISMIPVRLNGDIAQIFTDWVHKKMPDRADKILNKIKSLHKGQLNDSDFGHRMRGSGNYAEILHQQFKLARKKYYPGDWDFTFNVDRYNQLKNPQLRLF